MKLISKIAFLAVIAAAIACGGTLTGQIEDPAASGTWQWGSGNAISPAINTFALESGHIKMGTGTIGHGDAYGETVVSPTLTVEVSLLFPGTAISGTSWTLGSSGTAQLFYRESSTPDREWISVSGTATVVSLVNDSYTIELGNIQMAVDDGSTPGPSTPQRTLSGRFIVKYVLD